MLFREKKCRGPQQLAQTHTHTHGSAVVHICSVSLVACLCPPFISASSEASTVPDTKQAIKCLLIE